MAVESPSAESQPASSESSHARGGALRPASRKPRPRRHPAHYDAPRAACYPRPSNPLRSRRRNRNPPPWRPASSGHCVRHGRAGARPILAGGGHRPSGRRDHQPKRSPRKASTRWSWRRAPKDGIFRVLVGPFQDRPRRRKRVPTWKRPGSRIPSCENTELALDSFIQSCPT